MKILVVSWFFPPANTIGAVRLGNLVSYLHKQGHDIRVIAGKDLPFAQTLAIDFPEDRIWYARWADVNAPARALSKGIKAVLGQLSARRPDPDGSGPAPAAEASFEPPVGAPGNLPRSGFRRILRRLGNLYQSLINFPDSRIGWLPFSYRSGREGMKTWRPDVIFASGPPFTTLVVGYLLSRRYDVRLVAEMRDRWHDDPYYRPAAWRTWMDRAAEQRILRRAVAITTVSEPWAKTYRNDYAKPVAVICNGYDKALDQASEDLPRDPGTLRIVYTGGIYPGRRDPSPLFAALASMGGEAQDIRIEFYGTDPDLVHPLAEREGVADRVVVRPGITHDQAIVEQRRADVLLLMQWNNPDEQGNVPGKFFEYLGALRPILLLGLREGVPATIIRERQAGFFSNDPVEIAAQLRRWTEMKRTAGGIPSLPESARQGYTREDQFAKLDRFLTEIIAPETDETI